jgi:transposase InsO family protein
VLARSFVSAVSNRAWVTDVTYVATDEGWAYLAVMLDLYARRVVGGAVSATNDTSLALAALERAPRLQRPAPGWVHHSDRGSPYASEAYRRALAAHGAAASMSRRGDCDDNAVAESFFATLRAELADRERYPTHEAAESSIGDDVDNFYNVQRRHSRFGYLSPLEFELRVKVAAFVA